MLRAPSLRPKAKLPGREFVYAITKSCPRASWSFFALGRVRFSDDGLLLLSPMASSPEHFADSSVALAAFCVFDRASHDMDRNVFSTWGARSTTTHGAYAEASSVDGSSCAPDFIWNAGPTAAGRVSDLVFPQLASCDQGQIFARTFFWQFHFLLARIRHCSRCVACPHFLPTRLVIARMAYDRKSVLYVCGASVLEADHDARLK